MISPATAQLPALVKSIGFKNPSHLEKCLSIQATLPTARNSSIGERAIRNALQEKDETWQAHRQIAGKAVDILNHKLKIIVEYDGPTHFRNIYGAEKLQEQMEKDTNVEQWCIENGWKLYRVSENYFVNQCSRNTNTVVADIYNFINDTSSVLKKYVGDEKTY